MKDILMCGRRFKELRVEMKFMYVCSIAHNIRIFIPTAF